MIKWLSYARVVRNLFKSDYISSWYTVSNILLLLDLESYHEVKSWSRLNSNVGLWSDYGDKNKVAFSGKRDRQVCGGQNEFTDRNCVGWKRESLSVVPQCSTSVWYLSLVPGIRLNIRAALCISTKLKCQKVKFLTEN